MARSFFSFAFALAATALILLGEGVPPASAQPATPSKETAAPKPKQYPEVQEAINSFLRSKNIPATIKQLERAVRMYPELPAARVLMYQILAQLNQPNAARMALEEEIKTSPSDPEPYIILGNMALQERRIAEAKLDFDKANELLGSYKNLKRKSAMDQQALSGISQVAESREDWKYAQTLLEQLLALAPEDLVAYQRLARSLFWQGKANDAYSTLKKAKAIDRRIAKEKHTRETFLTPEAIMAQYYEQFEGPKSTKPKVWFDAALRNAPNDLPTRQVVAIWALERGDLVFAREQAEAVLRIEASDPITYGSSNIGHMLRGLVDLWEKKWQDAEKDIQTVIFQLPNDFVARNNIALALVEQDDPAKKQRALDYAMANYSANPKRPDALSTLSWVYFRRGQIEQAKQAIDQAIRETGGNINNADTATYLAHILYHQDQKWGAREVLEPFLKSGQPFSMKPEAEQLYEKVKNATKPTETAGNTSKAP